MQELLDSYRSGVDVRGVVTDRERLTAHLRSLL